MEIVTITDAMMGENCYLLVDGNLAVIIDPGLDYVAVKSAIDSRQLSVKYVLLTHGHYDHIHSLRHFKDVPVYAHKDEKRLLEDPSINMSFYTGEPYSAKGVNYYGGERHTMDGFEFIHTPGHTAGSVVICSGDNIFTGDTLFYDTIGRTDTPTGDPQKMKASIQLFFEMKPDSIMYPGHGEPFNLVDALKANFFLRR